MPRRQHVPPAPHGLAERPQLVVVRGDAPLQLGKPGREVCLAGHSFAEPQEGPHYEDAHLHGTRAVEERRRPVRRNAKSDGKRQACLQRGRAPT